MHVTHIECLNVMLSFLYNVLDHKSYQVRVSEPYGLGAKSSKKERENISLEIRVVPRN